MRSPHHATIRPIPMLAALLATVAMAIGACTAETGATAESSASAAESAAESMAESAAPSTEESAEASEDGGDLAVTIASFAFQPSELTVSAGDTVRFMNEDSAPHTVTQGTDGNADADAAFDEQVNVGEWVEVTFDEPGDYNVTCLFHSNMNMVVHVE